MMKTAILSVITAGIAAVSGAAYAQLVLPVTDNFPSTGPELVWEDYAAAAYTNVQPAVGTPSGNGSVLDVNDGSGWQCVYLTEDTGSHADYKISAQVYVTSSDGTNWSRLGIVARAQTDSATKFRPKGYHLVVDSDGSQYLRVLAISDGGGWAETLYADTTVTGQYTVPGWNLLELEVTGTSIIAHVNGTEILNGTSTLYGAGRVGIVNYREAASTVSTLVDSITVVSTAPPIPASASDWALFQ